ncbi:DUF4129 domain-containing protein [Tepidiforma sp.]|uniref:DUF4129 domain-containing protein n=1 Tax=Tepidiforma sp. TaxID=2682230 RepID=UPI002ADE53E6|nr:DUF4129 domain-containing protein [Tepidiforma sp.]
MIGGLAYAAALVAEALMLAVVAALAGGAFGDDALRPAGAASYLAAVVTAFVLPRWLRRSSDPRRAALIDAAIGAGLIYLLIRVDVAGDFRLWDFGWLGDFYSDTEATLREGAPAVLSAMLLAIGWARGAARADEDLDLELLPKTMALPFAVVIAATVLGAAGPQAGEVGRLAAGFFAAAVLALAASQLALSGQTLGAMRSSGVVVTLLGATAGLAFAGLVLFGLLGDRLGPVVGPPVGRAFELVLTIVLTPIAWALTEVFERLFRGIDPFEGLADLAREPSREAAASESEPSTPERIGLFGLRTLGLLLFFALVAGVLIAWARVRKRYARLREGAAQSGHAGGLGQDVRALLGAFVPRKSRHRPSATSRAARLYLEVLEDAGRRGLERPHWATPHEFAPRLHDAYATDVTDEITRLFEEARYGGREPDPARLRALERRWQEVSRGPVRGEPSPPRGQ